jgi:acyl-CoA synthetase (AMP-forming)/AMP-acid ligase II
LTDLCELFVRRAAARPDAVAYRFFQGGVERPDVMSMAALHAEATALAAQLQARGCGGRCVLLTCKRQRHFVIAFWACLLAGAVAVPTADPHRALLAERLDLLLRDTGAQLMLCDGGPAGAALPQMDVGEWLRDPARLAGGAHWAAPAPDPDRAAFLQYSSGSTGAPKGVIVTHRNVFSNCSAIAAGMQIDAASEVFTALPLFHDMGLVGGVLQPMFSGCSGNCMPPAELVQYPERWLQIVSAYRVTHSGGPNFVYQLACQAIAPEHLAGCGLANWRVAFCGAEPVRAATMRAFLAKFAPFGLRPQAFHPCYGMAESTLYISGKAGAAPARVDGSTGVQVVSCGRPHGDTAIAIVDPETAVERPGAEVGEIWVRGGSVSPGYWGRADANARTFGARLAGAAQGCWLRTGDLGYLLDGELYVTGRLKDLIIVYGKKYAPQDIEQAAEASHPALRANGGAAFSVERGGAARLVLVFELNRAWLRRPEQRTAIAGAAVRAIAAAHGVATDEVLLIKPGALPRTSSGKVRRAQCRDDYLSGALAAALSA